MATIVRNLPFFSRPTKVNFQGREVSVKADQIIVWVSLAAGLRAMRMGRFRVNIDCDALRCTIRTRTRFRVFSFR